MLRGAGAEVVCDKFGGRGPKLCVTCSGGALKNRRGQVRGRKIWL